jgi:hypothetical protein
MIPPLGICYGMQAMGYLLGGGAAAYYHWMEKTGRGRGGHRGWAISPRASWWTTGSCERARRRQTSRRGPGPSPRGWEPQWTLYPDAIESISPARPSAPGSSSEGPEATVRTHHNVGGLPPGRRFKVVEPLPVLCALSGRVDSSVVAG